LILVDSARRSAYIWRDVLPTRRDHESAGVEAGIGDPRLLSRAGAALFGLGGVIGFLALLLPGGAGTSFAAACATSGAALALGAALWFAGRRLSLLAYQAIAAAATTLVSVSAYYGGAEGWLNGFYYFWIGLFAAYFFRSAQIAFQLALVAAEYGLVLHYGGQFDHGALVWFLTVTTLGVTTALVAFLRNRLERALALEHERVERLEELDRLKDDFLATVSHELRTPVTAVYGAAETLRMRAVDAATHEELLRIVHTEATRLVELTNDLLRSTSIERGAVRLTIAEVDVLAVAADAAEAARLRAGPRPVSLRAPAGVASVEADPQRLRQVLMNLLDNALKYSPPEEAIELEVHETESAVRLIVRDRGEGIPPQERERIFEKFHRLDPHMRRGIGGSGLGLYIVRGLVDAMRGRVWIEPTALGARGTAVVVELPRSAPRAPATEARGEPPATSRSPGT